MKQHQILSKMVFLMFLLLGLHTIYIGGGGGKVTMFAFVMTTVVASTTTSLDKYN